jgi:hypothetical protein
MCPCDVASTSTQAHFTPQRDFATMCANAMIYNKGSSDVHKCARALLDGGKAEIKNAWKAW